MAYEVRATYPRDRESCKRRATGMTRVVKAYEVGGTTDGAYHILQSARQGATTETAVSSGRNEGRGEWGEENRADEVPLGTRPSRSTVMVPRPRPNSIRAAKQAFGPCLTPSQLPSPHLSPRLSPPLTIPPRIAVSPGQASGPIVWVR